ncbi:GMC oxidoreductase [Microbacterium sp. SS28]|uniref:GMC oxidoreductase n=1 Tax=Microbacterium sp. SS28 TaxID=2919948 RepID=UPI001FA950D0|nr:GMC family oxidoreductase [Microbacterium sp. SS28]
MAVKTEHVDAVVIGSGFGASVSAYRLADAGRSTVVLERGRSYPPGSFARNPYEMSRAFWEPKDELFGLFDIRSFRKLEGIVSAGLGGGSLIYANVLLRKDERWFVHDSPLPGGGYENWPIGRNDLDKHYDVVEAMMTPTPNPYPDLPKAKALRDAATSLGMPTFAPPLAVSFASRPGGTAQPKQIIEDPAYGNIHGATRLTCRLCGECDIGCNEGSKNTLDHNYLSAAAAKGADIRTLAEVYGVTPLDGGGYEVRYWQYGTEAEADGKRSRTQVRITCDQVFLGAGTFGTTALLLRNRIGLPALGRALGSRFSGNGDLITFCMDAKATSEAGQTRFIDPTYGPVITTAIRKADGVDEEGKGRGQYIQEAGFPEFANWLIETSQISTSLQAAAALVRQMVANRVSNKNESTISAEVAKLVGQGRLTSSSLPLLGMGRDTPDGRMTLRDGELDIEWSTATSKEYFDSMRETMRDISETLGGTFRDNPLWWTKRVITVHPLGGSPMGRHVHEGVVDSWNESFGHPGLFVVDGAAVPGPVGPNPSLTIAAMADRAVEHMLEKPRPKRRPAKRPEAAAVSLEPDTVLDPVAGRSMEFTEKMKGYIALGETDPVAGWQLGRTLTQQFMFKLTITAPDVERFVSSEDHTAIAEGYIDSDALGGERPVQRGWANLFVDTEHEGTREMRYRLWFSDMSGTPMTMYGFKTVRDDPGLDIWRDTSTLYITVRKGHLPPGVNGSDDGTGEVIAAGMLKILPADFARQLTTFRGAGRGPLTSIARFGAFFGKSVADAYLPPARGASVAPVPVREGAPE